MVPETSKIAPGVRKALGGVEKDADKTGQSMGGRISSGLSKALKVGAVAAGGVLAAGLGAALTKGFGRLTAIDNAQAKMKGLGHDTKTVDVIMKNALTSVKGTAFGLGEAATVAAAAVAAGIKPGKDLTHHLTNTANAAAAAGISFDEMGSIMNRAATQANGVQNDIISQLADRGIPIYQALGEQMGVTAGEVFKLASDGKVDFETFSAAAEAASGTVAEEMGKTFTGSLANAWAALGRVGANLLSGVFDKFAPALQGVTEWLGKLEPIASGVGEAIGRMATRFVGDFQAGEGAAGRLRSAFEAVGSFVVDTLVPAIRDLVQWLKDNEGTVKVVAAAVLGMVAAMVAYEAVVKVVRVAQMLLNAVMLANPIGIVVVAVGALVGVLVYLYNTNETARRIMDAAWTGIKVVISAVVGWFTGTAWPAMRTVFSSIGSTVTWLWNTIYKPYFTHIWNLLKSVGGWIKDTLWPWVRDAMTQIGTVASALWSSYIKPAFDQIWDKLKVVGGWVKDTLWPWMRDAFSRIGDRAGAVRDVVTGAWDSIKSGVSKGWDAIKGVFDKFKAGLSSLRDRFTSVKDGIASTWSALTDAVAGPIRTVVQFVNDKFLGPLESALRKIPGNGSMTLPRIPVPSMPGRQNTAAQNTYGQSYGGGVGGYAAGGQVAGWSPHDRADNIPAMLTAGEYVLPVGATRRLMSRFGPGFMEQLRRGLPGYADGGMVGGPLGDALAGAGKWLMDLFTDPKAAFSGLFNKLLSGIGESLPAKVAVGAAKSTVGKLASWVKDKVFGGADGAPGGSAGPPMRWQSIWALVKALIPDAVMTSNYRPGSVTAGYGTKSLHASGRAIDFALSPWSRMVGATKLLSSLKGWTELIHTPAGMWQQSFGKRFANFAPITKAQHYDHVHVGMADGGLVKPFVADSGALLRPGLNLLDNRTGGPEPLGRMDRDLDLSDETLNILLDGLEALMQRGRRELVGQLVTAGRAAGGAR